jgi:hypothetical protein
MTSTSFPLSIGAIPHFIWASVIEPPQPPPNTTQWQGGITAYTYSNNNKTVTFASGSIADDHIVTKPTLDFKSTGKRYFEVVTSIQYSIVGLCNQTWDSKNGVGALFNKTGTWVYSQFNGTLWSQTTIYSSAISAGVARVGVVADLDALTMGFYVNNVWQNRTLTLVGTSFSPIAGAGSSNQNYTFTICAKQSEFLYSIPSGYVAWED